MNITSNYEFQVIKEPLISFFFSLAKSFYYYINRFQRKLIFDAWSISNRHNSDEHMRFDGRGACLNQVQIHINGLYLYIIKSELTNKLLSVIAVPTIDLPGLLGPSQKKYGKSKTLKSGSKMWKDGNKRFYYAETGYYKNQILVLINKKDVKKHIKKLSKLK